MNSDGEPTGGSNIVGPANPTANSIPIWGDPNVLSDSKTNIDSNGSIFENVGLFPSSPPSPGSNTHPKIFYTSTATYSANTAPVGYQDLNVCNPVPLNYFVAGNTITVKMRGSFNTGVNPVSYTIRTWIYDADIALPDILCIANQTNVPYRYECEITFRTNTVYVCNVRFEYQNPAGNDLITFSSQFGQTALDPSTSPTIKTDANTAGLSPDNQNIIYSEQCTMSYS